MGSGRWRWEVRGPGKWEPMRRVIPAYVRDSETWSPVFKWLFGYFMYFLDVLFSSSLLSFIELFLLWNILLWYLNACLLSLALLENGGQWSSLETWYLPHLLATQLPHALLLVTWTLQMLCFYAPGTHHTGLVVFKGFRGKMEIDHSLCFEASDLTNVASGPAVGWEPEQCLWSRQPSCWNPRSAYTTIPSLTQSPRPNVFLAL